MFCNIKFQGQINLFCVCVFLQPQLRVQVQITNQPQEQCIDFLLHLLKVVLFTPPAIQVFVICCFGGSSFTKRVLIQVNLTKLLWNFVEQKRFQDCFQVILIQPHFRKTGLKRNSNVLPGCTVIIFPQNLSFKDFCQWFNCR